VCECRFKLSRNSLTVEVNLYDGIDFVCPYYGNLSDFIGNSSDLQYYVIHMVGAYTSQPSLLCDRVTRRVRPSVGLSVAYRLLTKTRRKAEIGVNVTQDRIAGMPLCLF